MVRDDLADVELAERVFAPHYARGLKRTVAAASDVRRKPRTDAEASSSVVAGEYIELFDVSGGWAWIRTAEAVGYVPADALAPA